jgi:hypothetical protein
VIEVRKTLSEDEGPSWNNMWGGNFRTPSSSLSITTLQAMQLHSQRKYPDILFPVRHSVNRPTFIRGSTALQSICQDVPARSRR